MASSRDAGAARAGMTWPQMLALAIGIIYTLIGIVGFFVTGFDDFAAHTPDETLLGFSINPLHNIVHIVIGVAGIALSRTLAAARTYGWLLAVGYGATFVYGLFAVDEDEPLNFLSINWADNWLHLVSALAGLLIALGPVRRAVETRDTRY
ncbi:DUF4383 domain-containing protein [Geodermatophilus sp. SYSU D00758]